MLIAHISLPADHPETAAAVLAEIMGGTATPFPPGGPDSWMAWSADGAIELEVTRRGLVMTWGPDEVEWTQTDTPRRESECHAAIGVDRPASEILAIAAGAGWPARVCPRGGDLFHVVEVWVEGAFLIEFLDPEFLAEYRARITPGNWQAILNQMTAGTPA